MILLADLALAAASILWAIMLQGIWTKPRVRTMDSQLGQVVSTFYIALLFVACLLVVVLCAWLSNRIVVAGNTAPWWVVVSATGIHLSLLLLSLPASLLETRDLPFIVRPLRRPIVSILSGASIAYGGILLHSDLNSTLARNATWLATVMVVFETVVFFGIGLEWLLISRSRMRTTIHELRAREDEALQGTLQWIESLDTQMNVAELIGYQSHTQHPLIREAAKKRLEQVGDWRSLVSDLMRSPDGIDVIRWLADEPHERIASWSGPLLELTRHITAEIETRLTTNRHLMDWGLDDLRIGDLLKVLSTYRANHPEFREAILQMQAAFHSPKSVVDSRITFPDLKKVVHWLDQTKGPG